MVLRQARTLTKLRDSDELVTDIRAVVLTCALQRGRAVTSLFRDVTIEQYAYARPLPPPSIIYGSNYRILREQGLQP